MAVLKLEEKRRYGNIHISLKNSYLLGKNNYPYTIPDVLRVSNNYRTEWTQNTMKPPTLPENSGKGERNSAVSFLKSSGDGVIFLRATNNSLFLAITCCLYGIKGHYQTHCLVATNDTGSGIESNQPGVENGAGGNKAVTG